MNIKQTKVFALMWVGYASTYLLRKPLGVGKSSMAKDLSLDAKSLGMLDTAMFVPYAGVQAFFGWIGDILGPKKTLLLCFFGSGLSMLTFGSWTDLRVLLFLLFLNGAFQSLSWANCLKAVSESFEPSQRSKIFGLFNTGNYFGGMVASALAVKLLEGGWENMFFIPSIMVILVGVAVLLFFDESSPESNRNSSDNNKLPEKNPLLDSSIAKVNSKRTLSLTEIMKIPLVAEIAFSNLLVKLVRYAFFMWLPMYLNKQLLYEEGPAGLVAMTFEIGGILGSAMMGFFMDRYFPLRDTAGLTVVLYLCTLFLIAFSWTSTWGLFPNCFFMILIGATNCGTNPVMCGTLPVKFAASFESQGFNPTSQITGFINGVASFGSVLEGPIIGVVADVYGWEAVFYAIIVMSFLSALIVHRATFTNA